MFTLFEESIKYHKFWIEASRYNKTNGEWRLDQIFSPQFVTCCPRSLISGNILQTSSQKFSIMTSTPVTICIILNVLGIERDTVQLLQAMEIDMLCPHGLNEERSLIHMYFCMVTHMANVSRETEEKTD